jgi:hypothetical protein
VGAADRVSARIVRALQGSSDEAQVVFLRSAQEVA